MKRGPGLFTGWWTDIAGNKIKRIKRSEYGRLYHDYYMAKKYENIDAPRITRPQGAPISPTAMNDSGQSIG